MWVAQSIGECTSNFSVHRTELFIVTNDAEAIKDCRWLAWVNLSGSHGVLTRKFRQARH